MMGDPQRPMYETKEDREREEAVVQKVAARFNCRWKKIPMRYRADYALLLGNEVLRFIEVKVRREMIEPYWISLDKWEHLSRLSLSARELSLIVVQWPGVLASVTVMPSNRERVAVWGGRRDRGDWQDEEPMVRVPLERFKKLEVIDEPRTVRT